MGVFFQSTVPSKEGVAAAIRDALKAEPPAGPDVEDEVQRRALALSTGRGKQLHRQHFATALAFFLALVVAGLMCDFAGLDDSIQYVYGFAATVLAAILGMLAGEGAAD